MWLSTHARITGRQWREIQITSCCLQCYIAMPANKKGKGSKEQSLATEAKGEFFLR